MQTCPKLKHLPRTASFSAKLKSASSSKTKGSLPPNYITALLRYFPAFSQIAAPVLEEPVKLTPWTA